MALDVVRELDDLLVLVRRRDRNQNGLVKAAADHLDLTFGDHRFQPLEIFRMMLVDPSQQRT